MIQILGILSSLILLFIGAIHFYWALGGRWGIESAIPVQEQGESVFIPAWYITFLVGVIIIVFALIYFVKLEIIQVNLPHKIDKYALKVLAFIFIVRAIGEFKYVGFFKKIKNTSFAVNDTKIYSPLCLFLGVAGGVIEFYS